MDITFSLQNGQYIAEFKVTSEFNLHIEKGVGSMQMLQRTSGTFFDKVEDFKMEKGDVVYDFDSGSFIGEKTIRLVSSVEPRYCFITTSGEVTEIKSQSKEVEVTANGTMDITPDAGFSYLNSVKVKTNVAQSGEGGGSTGVKIGYYNAPKEFIVGLLGFSPIVYLVKNGNGDIAPGTALISLGDELENVNITSFAVIEPNTQYIRFSAEETPMSPKEIMETLAGAGLGAATEITESEFYNLNA